VHTAGCMSEEGMGHMGWISLLIILTIALVPELALTV
jgi:hypothetical protein